ncbi:hypothetical protein AVEN_151997-1 [Araneus ventricosus]|uniref:Uncharacterized protein n=1 Tax=Araneus ventricosus TaxID=182803 RepID=A0A4Y2L8G8_ARAVE|nr:hypothetical protein AVEN_151997-1 [Araneus ventricosus]
MRAMGRKDRDRARGKRGSRGASTSPRQRTKEEASRLPREVRFNPNSRVRFAAGTRRGRQDGIVHATLARVAVSNHVRGKGRGEIFCNLYGVAVLGVAAAKEGGEKTHGESGAMDTGGRSLQFGIGHLAAILLKTIT